MSDVVNQTSAQSIGWQEHVVRMRANIGYMLSELDDLKGSVGDTSAPREVVLAFHTAAAAFFEREMRVFVEARLGEGRN